MCFNHIHGHLKPSPRTNQTLAMCQPSTCRHHYDRIALAATTSTWQTVCLIPIPFSEPAWINVLWKGVSLISDWDDKAWRMICRCTVRAMCFCFTLHLSDMVWREGRIEGIGDQDDVVVCWRACAALVCAIDFFVCTHMCVHGNK